MLTGTLLMMAFLGIMLGIEGLEYMVWVYVGNNDDSVAGIVVKITIATGFLAYLALPFFLCRDGKEGDGSLVVSMLITAVSIVIAAVLWNTDLAKGFPTKGEMSYMYAKWHLTRFRIHQWSLVMFVPKPLFYFKVIKKICSSMSLKLGNGSRYIRDNIKNIADIYRNGEE